MIPVSLSLKGIYSYRDEQTIDFTSLTANHLFGIFGPVGSGKSTILEAITLALYGETERLNSRDNRSYNMLNLKSSELFIDFVFRAGRNNVDLFRFTVQVKRDKKSFESTRPFDRRGFKRVGATWEPIEGETAEELIGLSYENFRRTIIIPQGKFQEFLELGDADRTKMLKEIFNLGKYDLAFKTDAVEKKNALLLQGVKGQLLEVGEVNSDLIREDTDHLKRCGDERKLVETNLQKEQTAALEMQEIKSIQSKIDTHKDELQKLMDKDEDYRQRGEVVESFEACQMHFPDLIKQKKDVESSITSAAKTIDETRKRIDATTSEMRKEEKEFRALKPRYDNRRELEAKWNEMESVRSILRLEEESASVTSKASGIGKVVARLSGQIHRLKAEKKSADESLKQFKASLPEDTQLIELKRWFDRNSTLSERVEELEGNYREEQTTLKELEQEKKAIGRSPVLIKYLTSANRKLKIEEILNILRGSIKDCKKFARDKEGEIESLKNTGVLESFASQLEEGDPCPLCGAEHHPRVYAGSGVKAKVKSLTNERNKLADEIENLQASIQTLSKLGARLESADRTASKSHKALQLKTRELQDHKGRFDWKGYSIGDEKRVDNEIERADEIKKQIKQKEARKLEIEEELSAAMKKSETQNESLHSMNRTLSELEGKRKTVEERINLVELKHFDLWTEQLLKKEIASLKKTFSDLEESYERMDEHIRASKELLSNLRATEQSEVKSRSKMLDQLKSINEDLDARMLTTGMRDLGTIEHILSARINVKSEKRAIQEHKAKVHSTKEHLSKLEKEKGRRVYDEQDHRQLTDRISHIRSNLKELDETIGRLRNRITEMEKNLKRKTDLESQKHKLDARAENLGILRRLFRSSKFVNYASRVYLENLCQLANHRFAQLTRQKLHLELRDDNSFQVRDFLNDGKVRSVKTLSGGQTFQASLSLALALADNVQQLAKTDQHLFFLDEGFGTLDKESLQLVFDALKALRKENRIVGVISHVDELKQEIDNCLMVRLDEQSGSMLEMN